MTKPVQFTTNQGHRSRKQKMHESSSLKRSQPRGNQRFVLQQQRGLPFPCVSGKSSDPEVVWMTRMPGMWFDGLAGASHSISSAGSPPDAGACKTSNVTCVNSTEHHVETHDHTLDEPGTPGL